MALFDDILGAVSGGTQSIANTSINQSRSSVVLGLTSLVNSAMPNLNAIPGAGRIRDAVTGAIYSTANNVTAIPTQMVGNGIQQVFDSIGVAVNTNAQNTNPAAYAAGTAAATNVWAQINSGNYTASQIVAANTEGLTALKYVADNLPISSGDNTTTSWARYSPYAMDLFKLAPKHKFLFVCEFIFNSGYDFIGQGPAAKNQFALVISDFQSPKIKYEYDEVSYYNFRTKVPKRVTHDPINIKFLDDRQNLSVKFFHEYLKATHPITNVAPESAPFYADNGMNFDDPAMYSGSLGSLTNDNINVLKEIRVYHLYDFGAKMNIYHFLGPKMLSVDLDDWSMSDSEGSHIVSQFGYDATYMELNVPIDGTENSIIQSLSNAGQYPLHPRQASTTESTIETIPRLMSADDGDTNTNTITDQLDDLGAFIEFNGLG